MKRKYLSTVYFLVFLASLSKTICSKEMLNVTKDISTKYSPMERKIICYLGSWSVNKDNFDIRKDFDPELCTHIVFAFATIDDQGRIQTADKGFLNGIEKLAQRKQLSNNGFKLLVAVGGSNKRDQMSTVFNKHGTRQNFVKSVTDFLLQNDIDGINIDWQFPREDGTINDKVNYVNLIAQLKEAFRILKKENDDKDERILSITIPSKKSESKGFDIPNLDPNVDFYCLLTYDYHSALERSANHHSLLFKARETSDCSEKANLNVNSTVTMYIQKKATLSKLVVGIPLFGKCFRLENPKYHKSGSPILGPHSEKPCNEGSIIKYRHLCAVSRNGISFSKISDTCSIGPYAYGNNIHKNTSYWIGYDDEESAEQKGSYIADMKLGGVSFWALDFDDVRGLCSGTKFPVIKATKRGMKSSKFQCRDHDQTNKLDAISNQVVSTAQQVEDNRPNRHDNLDSNGMSTSNLGISDVSYNPFRMASRNISTGIFGVLNLVFGVLGNIVTLIAIPRAAKHQRHDLHKNWYSSTIFVLNLALFDLGFCIFGMPQDIFFYLGIAWPFGTIGCQVFTYIGPVFAFGDWYALALIAISRYFGVVRSRNWKHFCGKRINVLSVIMVSWLMNILLCLPRFYSKGTTLVYDEYSGTCHYKENEEILGIESTNMVDNMITIHRMPHYIAYTVSSITIFVSYFLIWWSVRTSRSGMKSILNDPNFNLARSKCQKSVDQRLTVTCGIISAFFIISVTPLTLIRIFATTIGYNGIISLFWSQYSANILVYAARKDEFWKAYVDMFRTRKQIRQSQARDSNSQIEMHRLLNSDFHKRKKCQNADRINNPSKSSKTSTESCNRKINGLKTNVDRTRNESSDQHFEICQDELIEEKNRNHDHEQIYVTSLRDKLASISFHRVVYFLFLVFILVSLVILFYQMYAEGTINSKLLILGGFTSINGRDVCSGWLKNVEVIDLEQSSECNVGLVQFSGHLNAKHDYVSDDLPKKLTDLSGGVLSGVPIICGGINEDGETSKSCYKMITTEIWKPISSMLIERSSFASSITKYGFLIVGGLDRGGRMTDSVELLPSVGQDFISKGQFPKQISSGCLSPIDDTTAVLSGGYHYGFTISNSIWKYDFLLDEWEEMMPMKIGRAQHSCAVLEDSTSNEKKMVVAGGTVVGFSGTKSVEVYNFQTKTWTKGPSLPLAVSLSQLIPDGINGGCILVAGRAVMNAQTERLTSVMHLSSEFRDWKILGRHLKIGRDSHVAMLIPENLIQCSNLDFN